MTTTSEMAARTPVTRDRFVDAVRALSIAVVVFGHWLMAAVVWRGGTPEGENVLGRVHGLWIFTWLLQVMPLFFFVGGFSNAVAWRSAVRRGEGYASFVRARSERLARPALVFACVWVAAAWAMVAFGVPRAFREPMAWLVAQPLWFLGVYVGVVAGAPAMVRLHERYRWRVPAGLGTAVAVTDLLHRGAGIPIGILNFAFVWLFAQQLGLFLADGTLAAWSRVRHATLAAGGVLALAAMTTIGGYPPGMVAAPGGRSNVSPPTLCLVALTCWLVGLALLARPAITRVLQRERPWAVVVCANVVSMTAYLWHLTALVLAVLVLYPVGYPQPEPGSGAWWAMRPLWIATLLVFLIPLVHVFARFERAPSSAGVEPVRALAGSALSAAGLIGFAVGGFVSGAASLGSLGALAAGVRLLGPSASRRCRTTAPRSPRSRAGGW